jgi:hypothetical protein
MSTKQQPLPKRAKVRKAVKQAESSLVPVRARNARNARLVREAKKAIANLDGAHEAYYLLLEERATARAAALRQECADRERSAKTQLAEARAASDVERVRLAEGGVRLAQDLNKTAKATHDAQAAFDRRLRDWGDGLVVQALKAASSPDGGRFFLVFVSKGADGALKGAAVLFPPAAPYITATCIAKKAAEFLARKLDPGPKAADDNRYETALVTLAVTTDIMGAWAEAVRSNPGPSVSASRS